MNTDMSQLTEQLSEPGYFSNNSRWLNPLLGTLVLMISTFIYASMRSIDPSFESLPAIPDWLTATAAAFGLYKGAVFAFLTNTKSATIYLLAITALGNAGCWFVVIWFISSIFN